MKKSKAMAVAMAGLAYFAVGSCRVMAADAELAAPLAYYVAEFEVTDPEGMKPYSAQVESTFKPYGGHFIVRGGKTISLEGEAPKRRRVVIEFASIEKAQA